MFKEKRKHKRYDKYKDIKVTVYENIQGDLINISIGGMACILRSSVPQMVELDIIIEHNDSKISLVGTCISCETPPLIRSAIMVENNEYHPKLSEARFYFNTVYFSEETRNSLLNLIEQLEKDSD